jgi:hypothetical protein
MLRVSYHDNGKFESFQVSWKFVVGIIAVVGALVTGLISALTKAILIVAITIQGLFADPDSFYETK